MQLHIIPLCTCPTFLLSIHQLEGILSCFYFLGVVNRTAMNVAEQVPVEYDVESFGSMVRIETDGPYRRFPLAFWGVSTLISRLATPRCCPSKLLQTKWLKTKIHSFVVLGPRSQGAIFHSLGLQWEQLLPLHFWWLLASGVPWFVATSF